MFVTRNAFQSLGESLPTTTYHGPASGKSFHRKEKPSNSNCIRGSQRNIGSSTKVHHKDPYKGETLIKMAVAISKRLQLQCKKTEFSMQKGVVTKGRDPFVTLWRQPLFLRIAKPLLGPSRITLLEVTYLVENFHFRLCRRTDIT